LTGLMMQRYVRSSLCLILAVSLFLAVYPFLSAQTPEHLERFEISPLRQGEFLLFSKKPAEALKIFTNLWQQEPDNSYAVRGMVRSFQALNQLPEAASILQQTRARDSRSSAAGYGLGYVLYLQNRFEESKKVLNEAVQTNPDNALAFNNLAVVLAELKQYDEALRRVKSAIDIVPDELMFYRNLQMIYVQSGNPGQFEKEYRRFLSEGPPAKAMKYGLVLAQRLRQTSFRLYVDGKIDEALSTIVDMLAVYREIKHKSGIVAGLFSLAVLYEEQGDTGRALEKYREVLKINPQHIQARDKMRQLKHKKE